MSAIERVAEILELSKSSAGDALVTTGYADNYAAKGTAFQCRRTYSIGAGAVYKVVLDTSELPRDHIAILLPIPMGGTGGPVRVRGYKITSYTGGDRYNGTVINQRIPNAAHSFVQYGVTSSDVPGEDMREYLMGASGNPQQVARAGSSSGNVLAITLSEGAKVCIELTNDYTDTIYFNIDFLWYEIPFSAM